MELVISNAQMYRLSTTTIETSCSEMTSMPGNCLSDNDAGYIYSCLFFCFLNPVNTKITSRRDEFKVLISMSD